MSLLVALGLLACAAGLYSVTTGLLEWHRAQHRRPVRPWTEPPGVAVIVPCKGPEPALGANLAALLAQDYPLYVLVAVVQASDAETATAVEAALAAARSQGGTGPAGARAARLVRAPRRAACSEKINNLLAGLDALGDDPDILVFADSDGRPGRAWLGRLIAPLAEPDVLATTGYRWYVSGSHTAGGPNRLRAVWNALSAAPLLGRAAGFAWGGSLAIRRETMTRLKIPEAWARALSDDLVITRVVRAQGGPGAIRFVPDCLVPSFDRTTWADLLAWTTRQMVMVRLYDRRLFLVTAAFHVPVTALVLLGVALGASAAAGEAPFLLPILLLAPWYLGALKGVMRYRVLRGTGVKAVDRDEPAWPYALFWEPASWLLVCALARAAVARHVTWRGVTYALADFQPAARTLLKEAADRGRHAAAP